MVGNKMFFGEEIGNALKFLLPCREQNSLIFTWISSLISEFPYRKLAPPYILLDFWRFSKSCFLRPKTGVKIFSKKCVCLGTTNTVRNDFAKTYFKIFQKYQIWAHLKTISYFDRPRYVIQTSMFSCTVRHFRQNYVWGFQNTVDF